MTHKPVPAPTPETQEYWTGAARGELRIQRCLDCARAYFYPRPACPHCGCGRVEWFTASGRARLDSYVISERSTPGFEAPYVIATVLLAEGPRLLTNIVGIEPDPKWLVLDMPLTVAFEQRDGIAVPVFEPAAEAV
jgi:uncharacterized OB-fold protein